MPEWTFLTNHAHALLCVARNPDIRISEIAHRVGVTERAAHRMVSDLVEEGYLTRRRVGRRNVYEVHLELPLRHPLEDEHEVGAILSPLLEAKPAGADKAA